MNYERLIANCDTMIGWGHYYKSALGNRLLDTHKECVVVKTKVTEYSTMTLTELAEKYGESIDNLPMDVLMEAIYNERNASDARVLHGHESEEEKKA